MIFIINSVIIPNNIVTPIYQHVIIIIIIIIIAFFFGEGSGFLNFFFIQAVLKLKNLVEQKHLKVKLTCLT